jgi:hypothetical protein
MENDRLQSRAAHHQFDLPAAAAGKHPPLRLPRQPSSRRQTRLMPQAARCSRSRAHCRRQRLFRQRSEPMPLLRRADGADRPVSAIVACKPVGLARQLMNAALSISRYLRPPLSPPRAENAALLSRLRRRVQYAARVGKSSARDRRFLPLAARCQVDAAPHWNHYRPHSRRPPR